MGEPARFMREITGSRMSPGKSERMRATASRTSSNASCVGFSRRNSTVTVALPSCTLV
jgi:hypothetical protein